MSAAPKLQNPPVPIPTSLPIPVAEKSEASEAILHPKLDFWLIGGASIVMYFAYQLLTMDNGDTFAMAAFVYYLGFVVNWPHFAASYQMLYHDRGSRIFRKPSFLWAGVIVPLVLIGIMVAGFMRTDEIMFSVLVQVMYITVGWHYVKQIFGLMVISGVKRKFFFSKFERGAILTNFGCLWMLSFLAGQASEREADFWGVKYDIVGMPKWSLDAAYVAVGLTALVVIGTFLRRYVRDGSKPPMLALTAIVSLYVWYIPSAYHRMFFYVIPFFHSLQYLLAVAALKKGEWTEKFKNLEGPALRRAWLEKPALWFGASFVIGMAIFLWIPSFLDARMPTWNASAEGYWGPSIFMACFSLFINIHHYFIDNVIWTKDNPEISAYLLKK